MLPRGMCARHSTIASRRGGNQEIALSPPTHTIQLADVRDLQRVNFRNRLDDLIAEVEDEVDADMVHEGCRRIANVLFFSKKRKEKKLQQERERCCNRMQGAEKAADAVVCSQRTQMSLWFIHPSIQSTRFSFLDAQSGRSDCSLRKASINIREWVRSVLG